MPFTAARDSRKAAVRLTAITVSHSSSFMRMNRLSRVTPALLTRMSSPSIADFGCRHKGFDRILVGQIRLDHVDPLAERGRELVERAAPGARQGDGRALGVERTGDGAADAAGCAGDESLAAGEIEHGVLVLDPLQRGLESRATSSGVPMADAGGGRRDAFRQAPSAPCPSRPHKTIQRPGPP